MAQRLLDNSKQRHQKVDTDLADHMTLMLSDDWRRLKGRLQRAREWLRRYRLLRFSGAIPQPRKGA